uniref:Uncharacterized protein n=1 Tax=Oryza barthii TaxID=65489 RepID=A0A0D3FQR1_9ORYZ
MSLHRLLSTQTLPMQNLKISTKKTEETITSEELENTEVLVEDQKELAEMLEQVLICMGRAVEEADERNLDDFKWLGQWAAILREAEQRGNVLVGTIFAGRDGDGKAGSEKADDLYGFARADSWKLHELEERLQQALVDIGESVEIVPVLDIRRMEWLARWADVLKEAERQGYGVLDAVRAIADKEIMECDLEIDQLRSFVHSMESLAEDMEYFDSLELPGKFISVLSKTE